MFTKDVSSQHQLNRYVRFIDSCKDQVIEGYCEKHHIIPKSLGGDDSSSNLIKLTARQHFIAHLILSKIFLGNSKIKMSHAVWNMVNRDNGIRTSSRTYEMLRTERSLFLSEHMKGSKNPMYGKKHSEEHKKNVSNLLLGRPKPESQREKLRIRNSGSGNPQYGKKKTQRQIETSRARLAQNNPMHKKEVVDKIKKAKQGTVNCYDLHNNTYVRIDRNLFCAEKNSRYVGTTSKRIPRV